MKLFAMVVMTLFLGKSCSSQAQKESLATVLEYTANTRGFYQKITIQNQMVTVSKDRSGNDNPVAIQILDKDWDELIADYKTIDLDRLAALKAPSQKRFHDGAAIANLKIVSKDKTYESISFDHGNPPSEIKKLVDKINSFAKKE